MTKTAVMYGNVVDEDKYAIVDGDWTRFNQVWINQCVETDEEEALQLELSSLLWDEEGEFKIPLISFEDFIKYIRTDLTCPVIKIGLLP